ncbi:MAG: sigma-70 family RNA polymerase sigma factor [Chitinophagaceae bacterium]|nr:sigma-70 family RNA polymerase sigma factor [Chitinophagaceae bacterium]
MHADLELVNHCLSGDSLAQKELYDRFAPQMLGVCYRYVQNSHEAEDVLQDGFIRAFRYLKDFRGDGSLEGWLRRIMVTTALNYIKSQKNFRAEFEITMAREESVAELDALERLENTELMNLIQQLSPGYRAVLNLYAIEGYSHKEIGALLDIGESTSRSQFARAKHWLLKKLTHLHSIGSENERTGSGK